MPDELWKPEELLQRSDLCIDQTEALQQAYIETLAKLRSDTWVTTSTAAVHPPQLSMSALCSNSNLPKEFSFVYTPLHGVGLPFVKSVLSAFSFPPSAMHAVPSQATADPDFPTVKFPNPEEKGALDAAIAHADEKGIRLVLANDPDADRFCAAEKTEEGWRIFTGDQIGVMLGVAIFRKYKASGKPLGAHDNQFQCEGIVG